MKENRFTELLSHIEKKSFKRLEEFLYSPYHNKNEKIIELYSYIKKLKNNLNDDNFSKEKISKTLFGNERSAIQKTNLLISDFKKLLGNFILLEFLNKNKYEKDFALMKMFRDIGAQKNYSYALTEFIASAQFGNINNQESYYHKLVTDFSDKISRILDIIYTPNKELEELSMSIDLFFIYYKLIVYILMTRHRKETFFNTEYLFTFKKEVLSFISEHEAKLKKEHPLLYSYYLILMMLEEKNSEHYFNILKKYLLANQNRLDIRTFKDMLMDYKNNCDDRMHINQKKFTNEIYKVYKLLDEKNAYLIENNIEHIDFMNAILSALALNKIKWANYFFNKYKDKINIDYRNDMIHLVNANINFHQKKYAESLTELNSIGSKQFYFFLRIRIIRIQIYYEFNEIEAVNYIIDSLKHYLKRKKNILGIRFEIVNNFLNYLKKIIRAKSGKSVHEINALKKKISDTQSISAKYWLIDKINEIEGV